MVTDSSKYLLRAVVRKNLTTIIESIKTAANEAKIAMPPPKAIMFRLYLSGDGAETKPAFMDLFLTTAVSIAEVRNEAMNNAAEIVINVTI